MTIKLPAGYRHEVNGALAVEVDETSKLNIIETGTGIGRAAAVVTLWNRHELVRLTVALTETLADLDGVPASDITTLIKDILTRKEVAS